nr:EOG090X0H1B [Chydorus sphaericus]
MQTDEEVGKVAAAVPVIIYILFMKIILIIKSLLTKAVQITSARNAKTLSPAHLKQCILAESRFDFLKDLVMAVPDVQGEGEEGSSSSTAPRRVVGGTGRPRGRPRKNPVVTFQNPAASSRSRPSSSRKSGVTDSEDEEDSNESDDEDDEENSSDEDSSGKGTVVTNRKTTQNG